jgi:protein phosphatase
VKLIPGGATDQGQVRDGNEDGYVVDRRLQLYAVADGMGGHRAGEVASATALEALRAAVASGTGIGDAITSANAAVHGKATGDDELRGMGTTLTAVVPDGNGVLVGHVGDSRAYLLRDGELRQLTTDHSLVEELVREGRLTEEQAAVHPQRSVITRALGVEDNVEVDVYPVPLLPGDRLLICSDGLTTMLRPDAISSLLRRESDPTRAANLLVDAANAAGGEDNITTIVIDIEDDGADPFAPAPPSVSPEVTVAAPVALAATAADAPPAIAASSSTDAAPPLVPAASAAPASAPEKSRDSVPEGATAAQALAARERAKRRKEHNAARSMGRFARFLLPIVLILGLAVAVTAWYARRSYFVAVDHKGQVTIYQGRPGGLLLWDPTVLQHTKITKDELTEDARVAVQDRKEFDDKDTALAYVGRVQDRANAATSTTTSTTTTTTTVVPVPST